MILDKTSCLCLYVLPLLCYFGRIKKNQPSRLITNNVKIEPHETETAMFYVLRGKTVELIPPSNTPLNKNADFIIEGVIWESKCPMGKSLETIHHHFRKAARQSENIIFDLRHFRGNERQAIGLLNQLLLASRRARRLQIIPRSGNLIEKH